jgi:hypothetical protein
MLKCRLHLYQLKHSFPWLASSMPPIGFHRVTRGINIPREYTNHTNFNFKNERKDDRAIATDHALETLCFICRCAPMASTIMQIHFETGGGGTSRPHRPWGLFCSELRDPHRGTSLDPLCVRLMMRRHQKAQVKCRWNYLR